MSFESDLAKFVKPYDSLLRRYSEYLSTLILEINPDIFKEIDPPSPFGTLLERNLEQLKREREKFVADYNNLLPLLPEKTTIEKLTRRDNQPNQPDIFCRDLYIDEMQSDTGRISFRYLHPRLMTFASVFTLLPGSTIYVMRMYLQNPVELKWEKTKSPRLHKGANAEVIFNKSNAGYMERDIFNGKAAFVPSKVANAKRSRIRFTAPPYGFQPWNKIYSAELNPPDLGSGALDAFLEHIELTKV